MRCPSFSPCLPLFLALSLSACTEELFPAPAQGPHVPLNLLVISLDTTRGDRLGCYGHATAVTPTIDALAARGVVFRNAIAHAPLTLPTHASLFTGTFPPEHGIRDNGRLRIGVVRPPGRKSGPAGDYYLRCLRSLLGPGFLRPL